MKFFYVFLSMISARTIITRQEPEPVKIYSIRGRHLTILSNGRVGSTNEINSLSSNVKIIPKGKNEFTIQSQLNGLFISASTNGRLRAVLDQDKATHFTEENIQANSFNAYKLASNSKCTLIMRKNGKLRISCNQQVRTSQVSFLRRKIHQNRLNRGGHF